MISKEQIEQVITPKLEQDGLFLVEIAVSPSDQIVVLVDSNEGVTIEKCIELSRLIESSLDRDKEDFELEVSSPGLGEPLKVFNQYSKNIGRDVEVVLKNGKKFVGKMVSLSTNGIDVECAEKVVVDGKKRKQLITQCNHYQFDEIKSTKIVVTFR